MASGGIRTWLIQRATAVYLAAYLIFLAVFVLWHHELQYDDWRALFSLYSMQVGTILALLALAWHAWIGLNIILTDYVKLPFLRTVIEGCVLLTLAAEVIWGFLILWGN